VPHICGPLCGAFGERSSALRLRLLLLVHKAADGNETVDKDLGLVLVRLGWDGIGWYGLGWDNGGLEPTTWDRVEWRRQSRDLDKLLGTSQMAIVRVSTVMRLAESSANDDGLKRSDRVSRGGKEDSKKGNLKVFSPLYVQVIGLRWNFDRMSRCIKNSRVFRRLHNRLTFYIINIWFTDWAEALTEFLDTIKV